MPWRLSMKSKYDVLVIGGGPAGALAGKTAAEKGLSALSCREAPGHRCSRPLCGRYRQGSPPRVHRSGSRLDLGRDDRSQHCRPRWFFHETRVRDGGQQGGVRPRPQDLRPRAGLESSRSRCDVTVKSRAAAPILENGVVKGAKRSSLPGRPRT